MKIYKVSYTSNKESSEGFSLRKKSVIALLNKHGSHNDNG